MTSRFNFGLMLLAAVVIAGCDANRTTEPDLRRVGGRGSSADLAPLTSAPVLFNQTSTIPLNDYVIGDGVTYLADDFVVPAGSVWTVTNVGITGAMHDTYIGNLSFSIRTTDASGLPDAIVPNTDLSLSPTAWNLRIWLIDADLMFNLPTAITLPAGKYWLVIQSHDPIAGSIGFWQKRGDPSSTALQSADGGTTWQSVDHDYAFGIFGTVQFSQTITLGTVTPNPAPIGSSVVISATASSNLTVALAAGPATVCTLAGTTLSYVGVGKCTLTADQAGDATHLAAPQVKQDIDVVKRSQTITFPAITPNPAAPSSSATLGASASSALSVNYSSLTPDICVVNGSTVTYQIRARALSRRISRGTTLTLQQRRQPRASTSPRSLKRLRSHRRLRRPVTSTGPTS